MSRSATLTVDRPTLHRWHRRSNTRGAAQLAAHLAILCATGFAVWTARGTGWLPAAILLHGIVLNFLFCALHETTHETAFASRWLNGVVAFACGALLLLPRQYFRLFHLAHHRHTQDPARDPELAQPHPATLSEYLWRASGLPNWRRRITVIARHAFTGRVPEAFVPPYRRAAIVREARILVACYGIALLVSLLLQRDALLLLWILPAIAGQPFLRLYLLAEHAGCSGGSDALTTTRTVRTNAAMRFLAWQMPFHVEHHAYPAIPFHALRLAHERFAARHAGDHGGTDFGAPGYLAVHRQIVRGLRRAPAKHDA